MSQYQDYGYQDSHAAHAQAYIAQPLLKLLNPQKKQVILDLGCGNGALVNFLLENGFEAYGTDASQTGIDLAKKTNPSRFALQDLTSDELPEQFCNIKFDTIVSTEVIEHLYNPSQFIQFCKKILSKTGQGEIIISTPYHGYLKNLLISLLGNWDRHADPLWDGGHIKFWSRKTLTKLLEKEGFRVTSFVGCGRMPYLWKSMLIKARI